MSHRMHAIILGALLLVLAGCATVSGAVSPDKSPVTAPLSAPGRLISALTQQGSADEAIQAVIQRANSEQEQAIASRDSTLMRDTSTDAYYQDMVQTNQDLLDNGVTGIKLISMDWGPISVNGTSATATTYETWSTSLADGTTERSRDRNDYTLVQQDGEWRIQTDEHPDSGAPTGPIDPSTTRPTPPERTPPSSVDPAPPIVPRGRGQSANWAGYVARGGGYTSVTGTWTVPEPAAATAGADAAWIGIGGETTRDLIQAGTQQNVVAPGRVQYSAWIETLPQVSRTVPLAVNPGDSVTVTIAEQQPGTWAIDFTNNTTGATLSRSVQYNSSHSSAEWIEEAPSSRGGLLPLSDFGSITFTGASAVQRGQTTNLTAANAQSITMTNGANQPVAVPSAISPDGTAFDVNRTANNTGSRNPQRPRGFPRSPTLDVYRGG